MLGVEALFAAMLAALAAAQDASSGSAVPTPAWNQTVHTKTKVVEEIITWCPEPTVICINECVTVDKPTMLTYTDCPCTVTDVETVGSTQLPGNKAEPPIQVAGVASLPAACGMAVLAAAGVACVAL